MRTLFRVGEPTELSNGVVEFPVEFPAESCDRLVAISGDQNCIEHLSGGGGLIQGIAYWLPLGECVSRWRPGFGPISGTFEFHNALKVGSCVTYRMWESGKREAMCEVTGNDGSRIFSISLKLVSIAALKRGLRGSGGR